MDKTTRFADIAVETKFILGGRSRDQWIKVDSKTARLVASTLGTHSRIQPETAVVPEHDATVSAILGSWGKL